MTDVLVVGGGVMGYATAWHLLEAAPGLAVTVVEPDPTYRLAASSAASGGVRQLFTRPENVLLSRYTHEVLEQWDDWPAQTAPPLGWRANGYLFIAGRAHASRLRADYETQRSLGVDNLWLEPWEIGQRYPLLAVDDLGPGILSPRDGWLDPHSFRAGMRARALSLGATEMTDRVIGFEVSGRRVLGAHLESGATVTADTVINVAGVWGPALSAQLGLRLPVEPMRRFDHYVEVVGEVASYPFVKDPAGLAVRPEGAGLTAALVDFGHPGGFDLTVDPTWFEEVVWPALAHRFPSTDRLRLRSTWAGLYDQNRLDGNMVIDRWSGHLDNYLFATGFSGHGLMHAPGVGRALAELVLHREFRTIDLTRMGLARIESGTAYAELGIR